jgi:hypothetical protein
MNLVLMMAAVLAGASWRYNVTMNADNMGSLKEMLMQNFQKERFERSVDEEGGLQEHRERDAGP